MRRTTWIWVLLGFGCASAAWGKTAYFLPGAAGAGGLDPSYTASVTLLWGNPLLSGGNPTLENGNFGGATKMLLGCEMTDVHRVLLRFPVAGLAGQYSRLTRARLICSIFPLPTVGPGTTPPTRIDLELYRLASGNAGWAQGNGVRGVPVTGAACWAWRAYPDLPWLGSPGCSHAGVDFDAQPISTTTLTGPSWPAAPQLVFEITDLSIVEEWIVHPERNAGVMLRSSSLEAMVSAKNLFYLWVYSNAESTLLARPRLEVEYDPLPVPPPLQPLVPAPFQAGVAAFAPNTGYDTQSTALFSGDNNCRGGGDELRVGVQPLTGTSQPWRSLLKFDLAAMAPHAHGVRALRLTLTVKSIQMDDAARAQLHLLQLDRIAPANAAWREGSASAAPEPGAATWPTLAQGQAPWAAGAGLQQAGIDYLAPALASVVVNPSALQDGDPVVFDVTDASFASSWILQPATNAGFRLASPSLESEGASAPSCIGQIVFYSDDAAPASRRPKLEVLYDATVQESHADPRWLRIR